jgi:hypothetical protein
MIMKAPDACTRLSTLPEGKKYLWTLLTQQSGSVHEPARERQLVERAYKIMRWLLWSLCMQKCYSAKSGQYTMLFFVNFPKAPHNGQASWTCCSLPAVGMPPGMTIFRNIPQSSSPTNTLAYANLWVSVDTFWINNTLQSVAEEPTKDARQFLPWLRRNGEKEERKLTPDTFRYDLLT